jgi:hypothetical protein
MIMKSSTEKRSEKPNVVEQHTKKHGENLLSIVIFIILLVVVPTVILLLGNSSHWAFWVR